MSEKRVDALVFLPSLQTSTVMRTRPSRVQNSGYKTHHAHHTHAHHTHAHTSHTRMHSLFLFSPSLPHQSSLLLGRTSYKLSSLFHRPTSSTFSLISRASYPTRDGSGGRRGRRARGRRGQGRRGQARKRRGRVFLSFVASNPDLQCGHCR